MIVTRYTLRLEKGDWTEAHFELRIDDGNRPFHLVLRDSGARMSINEMTGDTWGSEQVHKARLDPARLQNMIIEVVDDTVYVLIDDDIVTYKMAVSQMESTLSAASKNIRWSMESGDTLVPMLHLAQASDTNHAARLNIAGQTLVLPDTITKQDRIRLLQATIGATDTYLQFMSGHLLKHPDETLVICDVDTSPVYAFWAAVLMPQTRICRLSQGRKEDAFVTALADRNGFDGIEILSHADITGVLASADGPVLIQGADAFKTLGPAIDDLQPQQRDRLSVWTSSDTIIPGNRVLPCANAQIRVPPSWTLNNNAAIDLSGRRPGLDIAIAAYNAREYLIDCATSLLCEGRDDIRVIIVDDGSSDGSGEMAAAHFKDDPRVRVEAKPNGGCASARNYGRLMSDATHITFVDADDFVSKNFFSDLYDLALYSGCEITQAGFDFYDESRPEPYYPSYEEELFKDMPRSQFGNHPVIRLQALDIIKGQPSIWRRVYRRDFLDAKDIYFPENIRAYDDYIFQMFSLTAARDILMLPDHKYHYRQHPAQDIRQGDERHFYMLYMFRMLIRRAVDDGWQNFRPYAESVIDSIDWSSKILRPDLIDSFLKASARLCVGISKTFGPAVIDDLIARVEHPDFAYHYRTEQTRFARIESGAFWSYVSSELYHPDVLHMRQALQKAN